MFLFLFALDGFERGGFFLQLPADAGAGAEEQVETALTRHTDWRVSARILAMNFKVMFCHNAKYKKKIVGFLYYFIVVYLKSQFLYI